MHQEHSLLIFWIFQFFQFLSLVKVAYSLNSLLYQILLFSNVMPPICCTLCKWVNELNGIVGKLRVSESQVTPRALLWEHHRSFCIFFFCLPIIDHCCLYLDSKMTTHVVGWISWFWRDGGYRRFLPPWARCHEIQGGGRIEPINSRAGPCYAYLWSWNQLLS